ncbi:hypothetical protein C8R46DRAFT_1027304 [Mycena filopes]|nr:hypothetical protein C8R46DRAFT_1027304 [Mycena filopes]
MAGNSNDTPAPSRHQLLRTQPETTENYRLTPNLCFKLELELRQRGKLWFNSFCFYEFELTKLSPDLFRDEIILPRVNEIVPMILRPKPRRRQNSTHAPETVKLRQTDTETIVRPRNYPSNCESLSPTIFLTQLSPMFMSRPNLPFDDVEPQRLHRVRFFWLFTQERRLQTSDMLKRCSDLEIMVGRGNCPRSSSLRCSQPTAQHPANGEIILRHPKPELNSKKSAETLMRHFRLPTVAKPPWRDFDFEPQNSTTHVMAGILRVSVQLNSRSWAPRTSLALGRPRNYDRVFQFNASQTSLDLRRHQTAPRDRNYCRMPTLCLERQVHFDLDPRPPRTHRQMDASGVTVFKRFDVQSRSYGPTQCKSILLALKSSMHRILTSDCLEVFNISHANPTSSTPVHSSSASPDKLSTHLNGIVVLSIISASRPQNLKYFDVPVHSASSGKSSARRSESHSAHLRIDLKPSAHQSIPHNFKTTADPSISTLQVFSTRHSQRLKFLHHASSTAPLFHQIRSTNAPRMSGRIGTRFDVGSGEVSSSRGEYFRLFDEVKRQVENWAYPPVRQ